MKYAVIALIMILPCVVIAQQQPTPPPNAPVELPEVLVTGKELIDVGAGSKQAPSRPPILSATRLDSLNPTEKLPIPRLPSRSLPSLRRPFAFYPGYIDASMGTLLTPSVAAGYSFQTAGYRIDLDADVEASQGWVDHSGYLRSALQLRSTYIAPDQFIVFGGSTTHVNANASYGTYNLFARPDVAERQILRAGAAIDVDGSFDEFDYEASVGYAAHSMNTTGFDLLADNALHGHMGMLQRGEGLRWGGDARVALRSLGGADYPFMQVNARGTWSEGTTSIRAAVGPQLGISTRGDERIGLAADVQADIRVSPDVSILASLASGLRQVTFGDLFSTNPYLDNALVVDVPYDVVALGGTLKYHPSIRFALSGSLRLRVTEREPVWHSSASGLFALHYLAVRRLDATVDARYVASAYDELRIDATLTQASVVDSAAQPYIPVALVSLTYHRDWTSALSSDVGVVYVGQRWADMSERVALSGYVDLRARVEYAVTSSLNVMIRAENILSSSIVLWEGYRERGFFATAGLTWRF
jgi:hypothetical protein